MKCPWCDADLPDEMILQESARINGRKSKRKDVPKCQTHKIFLTREGICVRCEKRKKPTEQIIDPLYTTDEVAKDQGW